MSFQILGDERDHQDIVAVGADGQILTSLSRQDAAYRSGLCFEAALARAAMVEGLLLHYLCSAKQIRSIPFDPATERRLTNGRMSFGQMKDGLKSARAFHDQQLEVDVEAYVGDRNQSAHNLIAKLSRYDLETFFEAGRSIAWRLWKHVLKETEPHRPANPRLACG